MEDTKKLESLSYESRTCLTEQAHLMNENIGASYHKPASASPEAKDNLAPIIGSETKGEKANIASQRPSPPIEGGY
jgi:hypothetical protein